MPPPPGVVTVDWLGPAPPPSLASALAARGVRMRRGRSGDGPCVVATGSRHPRPPTGRLWIWVPAGTVGEATATQAVLDGAYDVVPAGAADAAERIAARARELTTVEREPARPAELVAHSAAAQRVLTQVARVARTSMAVLLTGETGTGKE